MGAHPRFGAYFDGDGHWERTVAFRTDDPTREGYKRIVCGLCVPAGDVGDCRVNGGGHICEACGLPSGRPEAHDAALAKTGESTS